MKTKKPSASDVYTEQVGAIITGQKPAAYKPTNPVELLIVNRRDLRSVEVSPRKRSSSSNACGADKVASEPYVRKQFAG